MPVYHLTRRQSREVDRIAIEELGIPGLVLMENAARGVHDFLLELVRPCPAGIATPITLFCGKGNNGGDGLAVARHLFASGMSPRIVLTNAKERFTGDAATQLSIISRIGLKTEFYEDILAAGMPLEGIVVDAIYGTGFRLPSGIDFRLFNDLVSRGGGSVLSIDLPSGMDADTGETDNGNAVRANWTVTMMTPKQGFLHVDAATFTGQVRVIGLGIPASVADRAAVTSP